MSRSLPCLVACLALVLPLGCSRDEPQQARPKEPTSTLAWQELPALPNPLGFGGLFAGTHNGALIVAGGAHFPVSLFEGGTKVWVDSLFVLEPGEPAWHTGFKLPRPLAYGASVSTTDGVLLLGGCDADKCYADCHRLRWARGKVATSPLPPLPKPCAMTSAARIGDVIYLAGGQDSPKATAAMKNFWRLDLAATTPKWEELRPWPGPARILPVAAARGQNFYLFSGAQLVPGEEGKVGRTYLTDAYRFSPGIGWTRLADMPRPAVAAPTPAMPFGTSQILVCSGDDGANADRVFELKESHPGFPPDILSYDVDADAWSTAGKMPTALVTSSTTTWRGLYIVPSGEIRPGVRSPKVLGAKRAD